MRWKPFQPAHVFHWQILKKKTIALSDMKREEHARWNESITRKILQLYPTDARAEVVLIGDSCVSCKKIDHYNLKTKTIVYLILPLISTLDLSHVQVELILAPFICMKEFSNCPIGRRTFVLPVQTLHDMAIWHLLPWRLHNLLASLAFATFSLSSCPGKEHKEEDSRINSHCSKGFEFYWCR